MLEYINVWMTLRRYEVIVYAWCVHWWTDKCKIYRCINSQIYVLTDKYLDRFFIPVLKSNKWQKLNKKVCFNSKKFFNLVKKNKDEHFLVSRWIIRNQWSGSKHFLCSGSSFRSLVSFCFSWKFILKRTQKHFWTCLNIKPTVTY